MELPTSYFEPDCEPDFPYVEEELHFQVLDELDDTKQLVSELRHEAEQLIAEFYDSCTSVDRDVVHQLLLDITEKLDMEPPKIENLKL